MLVTLLEWASATFEGKCPSVITMRRWAVMGKFSPPAKKIGRSYYVEKSSVFTGRTRNDIGHMRNKKNVKKSLRKNTQSTVQEKCERAE